MTQQDAELTATLELELPADRILPAELDLIEAHLYALIQQMLPPG